MARYRQAGNLDDVQVSDGDVGYLGVNTRLPSWQLKEGVLSLSENGRIDGEWVPRKGCNVVTEGNLDSGTPLRLPFWIVDTSGGLTVSAALRVDETVTLTVTSHGLDNGSVAAAARLVVFSDQGVEHGIDFEAVTADDSFNGVVISVGSPAPSGSVTVEYDDSGVIEIVLRSQMQIEVAGGLTYGDDQPLTFPALVYAGGVNGKAAFTDDGTIISHEFMVRWTGTQWILFQLVLGNQKGFYSTDDVATPDLVTTWIPFDDEEGTPVVTATTVSTIADLVTAFNADVDVAAIATATAFGTDTNYSREAGPVTLEGGSGVSPAYLTLEGIGGSPTVDPMGARLMTVTDANTLTFEIDGATGSESYTVTSAKVRSVIDDFQTGDVLGSCVYSDPNDDDQESIFLAYGNEIKAVNLSDASVTTYGLPGSSTIDGACVMIQANDKVLVFRKGLVAFEWTNGDTDFAEVPSGTYTQPQILSSNGSGISIADGLVTFTVVGNTTIDAGDRIKIYTASDTRFTDVIGKSYKVVSANTTTITCYIPLPDSASGSNSVQIGNPVTLGTGFIHQPGFEWATYFQRRLWGPYAYDWDVSLTPDAFSARGIHDEIVASDILDVDTYDPLTNQFRITGGSADFVVGLHPFYDDVLLVMMRNSIHAVFGTIGSLEDCLVKELTRELGCLARKSVVSHADTVFFLSDSGVYALGFGNDYNLRGIERPLSEAIQPYIDRISENLANQAVGKYFENRYYLAVPLDSAVGAGDATGNNTILVFNMLNGMWESVDTFGDPNFVITDLHVASAGKRNSLYAISGVGGIHELEVLDEDYDNIAVNPVVGAQHNSIPARMRTRSYICGTTERKRFADLGIQFKSGTAQADSSISFSTDDPDNAGDSTLISETAEGVIPADETADIRLRVGGLRGFNGAITVERVIGRGAIRASRVNGTTAARSILTQK